MPEMTAPSFSCCRSSGLVSCLCSNRHSVITLNVLRSLCGPQAKHTIPTRRGTRETRSQTRSRNVEDTQGPDATTLFDMAVGVQTTGKKELAVSLYRECIAKDKTHFDAWFNLGHCLEDMDKFPEACACISQALKLRPDDKEAHLLMAFALEGMDDKIKAVDHYMEAQRLDSSCVIAYYNCANVHHDLGDFALAASFYRQVRFQLSDHLIAFSRGPRLCNNMTIMGLWDVGHGIGYDCPGGGAGRTQCGCILQSRHRSAGGLPDSYLCVFCR